MKKIAILGVSGSIGKQSVDVIRQHLNSYELIAASVNTSTSYLEELVNEFDSLKYVCIGNYEQYLNFKDKYPHLNVYHGDEGLIKIATLDEINYVINAVVGFKGLIPTLEAIKHHKDIGLANKETLVAAGELVTKAIKENNVNLYPIDSEHSAIFQCLNGENKENVDKIILTASGGSFRDLSRDELENVTLEQALKHPNWNMGAKITIDSATMVNKGLEVIEAYWLFNLHPSKIEVLIHPQSIIHSMVQFIDSAIKAQIGTPDMRIPISYALSYPNRNKLNSSELDFSKVNSLTFKKPDFERFPALKLAYRALDTLGTLPTVFNAANEEAVKLFMNHKLIFNKIELCIEKAMDNHQVIDHPNLEEILEADASARKYVTELVEKGVL